jgi:AraC-like DNA-binding protein
MRPEPRGEPGALLRPDAALERIRLRRHHPRPSLEAFVDYLWVVRWDVDGPYTQQVLTQPKVHLAAEEGRLLVYGVSRRLFTRRLRGIGAAVGAAFTPGGFRSFLPPEVPVAKLFNRVIPADDVWDVDGGSVARRVLGETGDEAMVAALEDFLGSRQARPDPGADEAARLVSMIERHTWLRRVDELAAESGLTVRSLQRVFREYVGATPKWVIQRRRLLDAAERVHAGEPVGWADLAGQLGYSDQAHLVRDFAAVVGTPPAAYAKSVDRRA